MKAKTPSFFWEKEKEHFIIFSAQDRKKIAICQRQELVEEITTFLIEEKEKEKK